MEAQAFQAGYKIRKNAFCLFVAGKKSRTVILAKFFFDQNCHALQCRAVATIGAMALAIYENGEYLEAIAVMLFYQIGEWF